MRFSPSGHAVMGVGDGRVSYDNAEIPFAGVSGEAAVIDESTIGFRACGNDGVYRLRRWNPLGLAPSDLDGQSATWLRAGGGVWAAFLPSGVRTSTGLSYPGARLCDVSPQGEIVLCPQHQVGRDLQVLTSAGDVIVTVFTGALGQDAIGGPNVRLRGGVLVYQADGQWAAYRMGVGPCPLAPRRVPINYAVPVTVDGQIYVLEREDARLTLRSIGSTHGWVIGTGDRLNGPDCVSLASGEVLIGWSTAQDEGPGSLETRMVRLDAPMVDLDAVTVLPVHVGDYGRTIPHFAIYALAGERGYGDYPDACLDAAWCGDAKAVELANQLDKWVIAGASLIRAAKKRALIWVASDTPTAADLETEIARAEPVARELGIGLYIHHDDPAGWNGDPPRNIPVGAICGVKAYRNPGESAGAFLRRVTAEVLWCSGNGHPCGLTIGIDDRGGALTEAELLDVAELSTKLIASLTEIAIAGIFSYGRHGTLPSGTPVGGGLVHPNVWAWMLASHAASAGVPDWTRYRLVEQASPPGPSHPSPPTPDPPTPGPPAPNPDPELIEDTDMSLLKKLPLRCYGYLHNSNIATVVPGETKVQLAWATQERAGYQELEVTLSKNTVEGLPEVMVRLVAANRLFRVNAVYALQQKYDLALETYDPAAGDADSGWQDGVLVGSFVHFLGPDVNGRKGIAYTLTLVDQDGKLFQ